MHCAMRKEICYHVTVRWIGTACMWQMDGQTDWQADSWKKEVVTVFVHNFALFNGHYLLNLHDLYILLPFPLSVLKRESRLAHAQTIAKNRYHLTLRCWCYCSQNTISLYTTCQLTEVVCFTNSRSFLFLWLLRTLTPVTHKSTMNQFVRDCSNEDG
jgi:hypothetical protein